MTKQRTTNPVRWIAAVCEYLFSDSPLALLPHLPCGRRGPGRGGASPSKARTPPSPTLPPVVPRGEREKFGETPNKYVCKAPAAARPKSPTLPASATCGGWVCDHSRTPFAIERSLVIRSPPHLLHRPFRFPTQAAPFSTPPRAVGVSQSSDKSPASCRE